MTDFLETSSSATFKSPSSMSSGREKISAITEELGRMGLRIMALHREANGIGKASLEKRRQAGALLRQMRARIPHGDFGSWCDKFVDISHTSRASYMKLDEGWHILEATWETIPERDREERHYTLAFALKAITGDPLWELVEEWERTDFRDNVSADDEQRLVRAHLDWEADGNTEAVRTMLNIANDRKWFIRDLLRDCGISLDDAAEFAVEAYRILYEGPRR